MSLPGYGISPLYWGGLVSRKPLIFISARKPAVFTEVFRGFPEYLQEVTEIIPKIMPELFSISALQLVAPWKSYRSILYDLSCLNRHQISNKQISNDVLIIRHEDAEEHHSGLELTIKVRRRFHIALSASFSKLAFQVFVICNVLQSWRKVRCGRVHVVYGLSLRDVTVADLFDRRA
jgi:hypothetical protein